MDTKNKFKLIHMSYLTRSMSYLFSRHLLGRKYLVGSAERHSLKLRFKAKDAIGRNIYKRGVYEEEITAFLENSIGFKEGDIILDIGANIGWYSLILGKVYPMARIFCFEPDPDNFDCLEANLATNQVQNVSPQKMGVSDETGEKILYQYKDSNTGRHSMLPINDGDQITIHTITIDDFFRQQGLPFEKLRFIKIDIEGFEYFAFKGGKEALQHVPYLVAEYSPGYMRKGGVEPQVLLDLMRSYDFEPYDFERIPIPWEVLQAREKNLNILWVKRGFTI